MEYMILQFFSIYVYITLNLFFGNIVFIFIIY